MQIRSSKDFEKISVEDTLKILETSINGLTSDEANKRLGLYGFNYVEERRESPVKSFLKRFWNPMAWLLEIAIVLSIAVEHYLEASIIFALMFINAVIGFHHEQSGRKVLELLKSKLAIKANVLRDGKWTQVDAKYLVPGDLIALGLGDVVPADCKIIEGDVTVDQSMLTGESLPVEVSVGGVVYSGSIIRRGSAKAIVINTGRNTYFGKTVELVKIAQPKSHQQEVMFAITRYSMYIGIAAIVIAIIFAVSTGLKNTPIAIATFAVTILMGAVPVALPAVLTIMQAVGASRLASRDVLVTRLSAIEDAASVDIMCLDKTGTITENRLSIADVKSLNGFTKDDVIEFAFYASSHEGKDQIDSVIVEYAKGIGLPKRRYKVLEFKPFDPSTKRAEALVEVDGERIIATKGAPQIIAKLVNNASSVEEVEKIVEEFANRGFRSLAVAVKKSETSSYEIVGVIALFDPPRPNAKQLIDMMKSAGVKPKMVTGDNVVVAKEIAKMVGIGENAITVEKLKSVDENARRGLVEEADVFAEVYPEDKYIIVKSLQSNGHFVGVMGDGVNDAPALKQAELGIAVANATDVAKASAGAVLLKPGLEGVVDILLTGREVYQRALTWIINKVTKTIQFTLLLVIGFIILRYDVLSLLGMTLLVFANDFATMSLATDNAKPTTNPSKWRFKELASASTILGVLLLIEGLIAIYLGQTIYHFSMQQMQTFILLIMVFTSQFRVLIVRERSWFWKSKPGRELAISIIGVIATFIALGSLGGIITPIGLDKTVAALAYSALFTIAIDPAKVLIFKKFNIT
ncbi:plasma-membrane proton-efflux P-type ATPase [Ignisphaera sp. 4213-co]|uniref:Plasma-membrane proton-efflux P-type ATPase n=1 Tax=Ignisphaera cupida TaxID=3050454 RepID=A0ABD4Z8B7_9CREN|nr:plasma-membrane proton-efflux P-type ATPase [Ignisphaera sp. 4213-co]MDK6029262.1 plasma-membrane proton-efflux P-type ATPase [Ignisphaera sp. 4213-co]